MGQCWSTPRALGEFAMNERTLEGLPRNGAPDNSVPGRRVFAGIPDPQVSKLLRNATNRARSDQVQSGRHIMANSETLVSLIEGVCQRDPKRWDQFDAIYRPMMMEFLRKRGVPEFKADEVVQQVFWKLLHKIHTYDRSKSTFRSWLFTVVNRTLIDIVRREYADINKRRGWVLNVLNVSASDSVELEKSWATVHRKRILKHALKAVRARVSDRVWACFELSVYHELPAAEIRRRLGIKPGAVYVNVHRVMKYLREYCREFEEDVSHAFESDLSS
jgi:RNA polymerase sigma-70 factor (ECF subfamily)